MQEPAWNSEISRYGVIAGVIPFAIGLNPFSRYGNETWLTGPITSGPELVAGFSVYQVILMALGLSIVAASVVYERTLS